MNYIYGLFSTRNNIIRYVGKTYNLEKRLREHLFDAKLKRKNKHKSNWISKEIKDGFSINIKVLEIVDKNWEEQEIFWISQFENLTNKHKGGKGGSGKYSHFLNYSDAKLWVKENLTIKNEKEWRKITDLLPRFIPKRPDYVYKECGWIGYLDFLSIKKEKKIKVYKNYKKKIYLTYNEAYNYIKTFKFNNKEEYILHIKNNNINFLPTIPAKLYSNFKWYKFLDLIEPLKIKKIKYVSYNIAKTIALKNSLKSRKQWINWWEETKPTNLPKYPNSFYKKDWINWNNFLSTNFLPYILMLKNGFWKI